MDMIEDKLEAIGVRLKGQMDNLSEDQVDMIEDILKVCRLLDLLEDRLSELDFVDVEKKLRGQEAD